MKKQFLKFIRMDQGFFFVSIVMIPFILVAMFVSTLFKNLLVLSGAIYWSVKLLEKLERVLQ